jgi:hypothetical protein
MILTIAIASLINSLIGMTPAHAIVMLITKQPAAAMELFAGSPVCVPFKAAAVDVMRGGHEAYRDVEYRCIRVGCRWVLAALSLHLIITVSIKKIKATAVMKFLHAFTNFQTLSPKTIAVFKSPANTHTQSTINITMVIKRNILTPTLDYRAS